MEDSRNIIKAIDALTLKAGGEVVDSKNITEAIDKLRAVYNESAIGIDKTLTQEGVAADAEAVGNAIDDIKERMNTKYLYRTVVNASKDTFSLYISSNMYVFFYGRIGSGVSGIGVGCLYVNTSSGNVNIFKTSSAPLDVAYDTETHKLTFTTNDAWSYLIFMSEKSIEAV